MAFGKKTGFHPAFPWELLCSLFAVETLKGNFDILKRGNVTCQNSS